MAGAPTSPPLFGLAPAGACSRWLGDRNCGETPVMHVVWDDTMENGFVCAEHVKELGARWSFLQAHEVGPDCGMPESRWFFEENVCRCTDEIGAAEFQSEIAICGENGGGGNRTRVSVHPDPPHLRGDSGGHSD